MPKAGSSFTIPLPNLHVLFAQQHCVSTYKGAYARGSADAHRRAAEVTGVPFISLPDLTGCSATIVGPLKKWMHNGHFEWPTHELMHSLLSLWFEKFNETHWAAADAAYVAPPAQPLALAGLRESFRICEMERTVYDARAAASASGGSSSSSSSSSSSADTARLSEVPNDQGNHWQLAEDRPGKWRWITNTTGAALDFPLSFGASPRVTVVYTQGYENYGNAWFSIIQPKKPGKILFKGKHPSHSTQSHAETINVKQVMDTTSSPLAHSLQGFSIPPFTNATARLVFAGSKENSTPLKFSVVYVASC